MKNGNMFGIISASSGTEGIARHLPASEFLASMQALASM
jgi:hypothetical protein